MTNQHTGCSTCEEPDVARIEDEDCVLVVHSFPVSLDLSAVVIQYKDEKLLLQDQLPSHPVISKQGDIYSLALLETRAEPLDLTRILHCPEASRHRAEGWGGVWNPRRFRCDSRHCRVDCRSASCASVTSLCQRRFDRVCGSVIACYRC